MTDRKRRPERLQSHAEIDATVYQGYFWLAVIAIILFTVANAVPSGALLRWLQQ